MATSGADGPRHAHLRLAVIGCGERGAALASAIGQTGNTRLSLVMDAEPTAARALGERLRVPWTTSLDEIVGSPEVDAVVISTPHDLHAPQAISAAKARKHIIVEKPLATSLSDAVAMVRTARACDVRLSAVLSYRYLPHVQHARKLIAGGVLGQLLGASLIFQRDGPQSGWRVRRRSSGGGVLINQTIHYLDWLRFLSGVEPAAVSAYHAIADGTGDVEDTAVMWIHFGNGALGTVNAALCARGTGSAGDLVECRLWGRDGHISLTPPYQFYSLRLVDGKRPGQWHAFAGQRQSSNRDVVYLQRFAERVLSGQEPEITGEDGLAVQALVEAAYRSAEAGHAVRVEREPWTNVT